MRDIFRFQAGRGKFIPRSFHPFPFIPSSHHLHQPPPPRVDVDGRTLTFYISSLPPDHHTPAGWLGLICGHWAGVEIRNHWRRDAILGQDRSRSRNPNLLANLALLRSALLSLLPDHFPGQSLPAIRELLHSNPAAGLNILSLS